MFVCLCVCVDASVSLAHLARLHREAGGDVIIARAGQPVGRLVRVDTHRQPRIPGRSRGQIEMSEDFDQPMPDLESMIYGTGE